MTSILFTKWKPESGNLKKLVFLTKLSLILLQERGQRRKKKDFTKEVVEATYEDFRGQLNNPELMEKVLNY